MAVNEDRRPAGYPSMYVGREIPPPMHPEKTLQKVTHIQRQPTLAAKEAWEKMRKSPHRFTMESIDTTLVAPHAEKPREAALVSRYIGHGWDIMNTGRGEYPIPKSRAWFERPKETPIFTPVPYQTADLQNFLTQVGAKQTYAPTLQLPTKQLLTFDTHPDYENLLSRADQVTQQLISQLQTRYTMTGEVVEALTLNLEKPDSIYAKIGLLGGMLPFIHPGEATSTKSMYPVVSNTEPPQKRWRGN